LCTICARGGSKGVKSKNTRVLLGKPLIAWTIEQAIKWGRADDVVVSTDSTDIARISQEYGALVPFMRPDELATDSAPKVPVIQHALGFMEKLRGTRYHLVVDLDPTSPLREIVDIENAYARMLAHPLAENLYSVCRAKKSPYFNMVELDNEGYSRLAKELPNPVFRRQDAPIVFEMNASIYVYRRDFLVSASSVHSERTLIYEMPPERSVDIDSEVDFTVVEQLMKKRVG
jgi:N-acylneuraminate cytidylyltransferase/CMP-N,N'-diacetyllegionaminic acid synthase